MNFIDRQTEPMPDGAAQSTEQPMVEKSITDALVARVERLEQENAALRELVEGVPTLYAFTQDQFDVKRDWLAKRDAILNGGAK